MYRHYLRMLAAVGLAVVAASVYAANPQVELDTTAGKIRIELYPDAAPKTVENFLAYVQAKQYDGTQFHRVIPGFMIQGGGYTSDFKEKPTRPPVRNEAEQSSKAGLLNVPGSVAMARTSDPNSATAQFFINVGGQQISELPRSDAAGHTATRSSARSLPAWTSSTRSPRAPTSGGGQFPKDVPVERVLIKSATLVTTP